MVMHIIWMVVIGLVVGWVARMIVPGNTSMGWVATALLGIIGAYVGGTLGSVVFPPHELVITPPIKHSFLGALVVAGAASSCGIDGGGGGRAAECGSFVD